MARGAGLLPGRTVAWLAKSLERALAEEGLSLPQYRLLAFLSEGSAAATALAGHLAVSPPSLTALADGLVARGLVERRSDDTDRRRVAHVVTQKGLAALGDADGAVERHLTALADRLPMPSASGQSTASVSGLKRWGRPAPNGWPRNDLDRRTRPRRLRRGRGAGRGRRAARPARAPWSTRPEPRLDPAGPAAVRGAQGAAVIASRSSARSPPCSPRSRCPGSPWQPSTPTLSEQSAGLMPYVWILLAMAAARAPHLRLPIPPLPGRVRRRVRPARRHVRAPHAHVVLVLRPRAVRPAHLPRQLRHPLGADVPDVRAAAWRSTSLSFFVAFGLMLSVDVALALVALAPLPFVYLVGVRMRDLMFPISWIDPGAHGRHRHDRRGEHHRRPRGEVVRRRAVADPRARGSGPPTAVGVGRGRSTSAPTTRRSWRTCLGSGMAAVLLYGGILAIDGRRHRRHDRRVHHLRRHAPGAVPHARLPHDDGPARRGLGRTHLRDPRRRARDRRPAGRRRPRRRPRATSSSAT